MNFKVVLKLYWKPVSVLIAVIILTWIVFLLWDKIGSIETRITGIITFLGLGFTVFQFWVSEINKDRRQRLEFKYNEYLRAQKLLDAIPQTLNKEMGRAEFVNPHGVSSTLMNLIGDFKGFVNNQNDHFFSEIKNEPVTKELVDNLNQILLRTDQMRKEIEDYNNRKKEGSSELVPAIEEMNWHNAMRDYLSKLNDQKYSFYKLLRSYLK